MKRYNSTLIKMTRRLGMAIAALLMLSTMASCSDQDSQAPATGDEAYLNLSFSTASTTTSRASRAGDIGKDETPANPTAESDIHSIKVWVFKSESGANANPIAYKEDTPPAVDGKPVNGNYTLNLRFLRKINGEELKNIDLYILANSESTNMEEKLKNKDFRSITRADLQGVTFDDPFGIKKADGKAQTTKVPEGKGLPISRAITNIEIAKFVADTEIEAKERAISIPLVRAVSKLHFYFARKNTAEAMTENVKVTRIEIDGNTFPTESYVFPNEEDYATADANKAATSGKYGTPSYVPTTLKLDGVENKEIKEVEDPLIYTRGDNETAQAYMNRIKEIGEHDLCYLRETNKPITGKIYYQLAEGGSEKFREFTIPSEDKAIRNRELVVYGYFLQGGALCLDLQPIVSNWVDNIEWDYTDKVSIEMEREPGKFGEAVEVHYGIPNGGGPAITLNIDTGDKNWILQCDNPDFAFYVNGKYYDTVSKSNINGNSFTFYVVPKRNKDLAVERNFDTKVFIVLAPDMRNVLFNVGDGKLPGDDSYIKFTQGADRSGI